MALTVEYRSNDGYNIIQLENGVYYGNGKTVNAFGVSANQFLRFNPYMEYVLDKGIRPDSNIVKWIESNTKRGSEDGVQS